MSRSAHVSIHQIAVGPVISAFKQNKVALTAGREVHQRDTFVLLEQVAEAVSMIEAEFVDKVAHCLWCSQ